MAMRKLLLAVTAGAMLLPHVAQAACNVRSISGAWGMDER